MEGWQDGHGLGTRVEARLPPYDSSRPFMPGRISRNNFDGTYGVDYDNGEKGAKVPKDTIKAVSSEVLVNRHTRVGLDLTQRMRRLAEDAREVTSEGASDSVWGRPSASDTSAKTKLREGLEKLFKKHLLQQEKALQAHKETCATPDEAGEDVVSGVLAKHVRPASGSHAPAGRKKPRPPLQGGKTRKVAAKAGRSRPKLSRGEVVEATFLGGRSWYPARVARVVEHHQELSDGAVSTEIRFDVFYPKASRRGRIEEAVRSVLQRCGDAGEVYTSSDDQKESFEFDEAKGLAGQRRILKQLGDELLANVASLGELEWIGPMPKLGTAMNARKRRTHTYVVPKSAVDKAFEPVLMSIAADPTNSGHAKSMLGLEFRSSGKKVRSAPPILLPLLLPPSAPSHRHAASSTTTTTNTTAPRSLASHPRSRRCRMPRMGCTKETPANRKRLPPRWLRSVTGSGSKSLGSGTERSSWKRGGSSARSGRK